MTPLAVAIAGAIAGAVAALVLTPLVPLSRLLLGAHRAAGPPIQATGPGPILSEAGRFPPDLLAVTAVFVQKVATGIFGASLPPSTQRLLGTLWHLGYGGFWGVGLALLISSVPVPPLLIGPSYGLLVWAVGPAWLVPRMRLLPRPLQHPPVIRSLIVVWHLAYGLVAAMVFVAWAGG